MGKESWFILLEAQQYVANFINKPCSPTESALDPPYGEIQESYLIYDANAMQNALR